MFCKNCGKQVDDKAVICVHCGVPPKSEKKYCNSCGVETLQNQVLCTHCGVTLGEKGGAIVNMLKEKPIAFVLSVVWIIFFGIGSIKEGLFSSSFSFATFIFIGVMPILGYWIYHLFIHKKS